MRNLKATGVFLTILAALGLSSCAGSASNDGNPGSSNEANVFTVGTDAPLPSVISCQVLVTGVTLNNGSTNVPVLTTQQVVDFAQLSGLHQLLDLNAVPPGTYMSATVTVANPVIAFIDTTQNPPAVNTINGTLSQSTVTVNLVNPFVINSADLVGLRMEFDLAQSLQTDANAQITGVVNPVFHMQLFSATDPDASIDDFLAGVVGVTSDSSFVVQGPKGRQWTVQTNSNTMFDDPSEPISSFTTNTIVQISGQLDPVSKDIDASEIEVLSNDKFFLAGLFTSIRPPSGPATQADLYVRAELPDLNGIQDGQITTLTLNGSETYKIANVNSPITTLLFNNSLLAAGQSVGIGGSLVTNNGVPILTVHRVVLRRQGQAGPWVPGSTVVQSGNNGSFQFTDNWTAGVLLPNPLTVYTTDATNFINLSGLSALTGSQPIPLRVVGFIFMDSATNAPVMVARSVEQVED
ncbi:MAG TPA: DUF5666 domain-containing protein [Candidatus Acidoferrales bacterium]|nr:DUF5666 domain-containing protein [Candidatus Acidoferrales bacterium]